MAKNFDDDIDDLDSFEDFDFDDLEDGNGNGEFGVMEGKGRNPVQNSIKKTYNATVEEIKSRRIRDHALGVMEKGLTNDGRDALSELKYKVTDAKDEALRAFEPLRKEIKGLTKGLADAMPTGGKLHKLFSKINEKFTKESDYNYNQQAATANALEEFKSEMGANFNAIQNNLQAAINSAQKSQGMGSLLQQGNAIQNLIKEQNRIYYTKSLELQWRIAHATEESNKIAREQFEGYTKILNTIVHNTALPEAVKITNAEMAMQNLKNQAFNTLNATIFKQVMPIDKIKTTLITKLRDKLEGIQDTISPLGELVEMSKEMKEGGMSPEEMVGSQIADFLMGKVYGGAAKLIPRKYRGRVEQGLMGLVADPMAYLKAQRKKEPNGVLGKLYNKAVGALDDLVGSTNPGMNNIKLTNSNLNGAAIFDGRTHSSINIVIPRLLSKIHAEVQGIRTGNTVTEDDELRYDITTGDFITKGAARKKLRQELEKETIIPARKTAKALRKQIESVLENVNTPNKNKILNRFEKAILAYIAVKGHISPDVFTSAEFLKYFPAELQLEASQLFQEVMVDLRNYNKLSTTYAAFKNANSIFQYSPALLQQRIGGMNTDLVREAGLLEINKYNGETSFSAKGFKNLMDSSHRIKASKLNNKLAEYYEDDIDWAEDTRSTLNSVADFIQEVRNVGIREALKGNQPDYFSEGGKYTGEHGVEVTRTANVLTEDELFNNERIIKKRQEMEEFVNSEAMKKLKIEDPEKYNKELEKFSKRLDDKYDKSLMTRLKEKFSSLKDWGKEEADKLNNRGEKSIAEYAKEHYDEVLKGNKALKTVNDVTLTGIQKSAEVVKDLTKKARETETGKKIEDSLNQAIDNLKRNEKVQSTLKNGKTLYKNLKGSLKGQQEKLIDIINKNVVTPEQRKAAIAHIRSLTDKEKLKDLVDKAQNALESAAHNGEDIAILALRSMAGDETSKAELKEKAGQAKDTIVETAKNLKDKGLAGFDKLNTSARQILERNGIRTPEDALKYIKENTTNGYTKGSKKLRSVLNKLKEDLNTPEAFSSGQSAENVEDKQAELKARLMKKHGHKLSNRQGILKKGARRFIQLFTKPDGSTSVAQSTTPFDTNTSTKDSIKKNAMGMITSGLEELANKIDSKLGSKIGTNFLHKVLNKEASVEAVMTPSQLKQLKEEALKAGKGSDLYKQYRDNLRKSILTKTKEQAEKAVKAGAITAEQKKQILDTIENLDDEKLKDPFFVFSIFRNLGGIAKWTAGLAWEVAKTGVQALPKFWKSGFAKSMRQRERDFYKGIGQRFKGKLDSWAKKSKAWAEAMHARANETPEEKAKRRKGSWLGRLDDFAKRVKEKKNAPGEAKAKVSFFDKLKGLFKPLLFAVPIILGKIKDFLKPIGAILSGIWSCVKPIASLLGNIVSGLAGLTKNLIGGAVTAGKALWNAGTAVGGRVAGSVAGAGMLLKDKVKSIGTWIGDKVGAVKSWVGDKFGKLAPKVSETLAKGYAGAKGLITTGAEKVGEAASKMTKASVIDKIIKVASEFKTFIVKRFGKKASVGLLAKLGAKIAARAVPIAGQALLAWDAGWILGYMANGMSLKSAISKQILGFDLFNAEEEAKDEDGNPIKPDGIAEEEQSTTIKDNVAESEDHNKTKENVDRFTNKENKQDSIVKDEKDIDVNKVIQKEQALNNKRKTNMSKGELLQRQFALAFSMLKPEDRSVELWCHGVDGVKRKYGEYEHGSYTLGEADPEIVWDAKSYPEYKIGKMKSSWWTFGFGAKDNFDPIDLKEYVNSVKDFCSTKNLRVLLDPQSKAFAQNYLAILGSKIMFIKEAVIAKAKKIKGAAFDNNIAKIIDKDHGTKEEDVKSANNVPNGDNKNTERFEQPKQQEQQDANGENKLTKEQLVQNLKTEQQNQMVTPAPANNASYDPHKIKGIQKALAAQGAKRSQAPVATPYTPLPKSSAKPASSNVATSGSASANKGKVADRAKFAADYATTHKESKSIGKCARYVRHGLAKAGYPGIDYNNGPDAWEMGPKLQAAGFTPLTASPDPKDWQVGDILVFQPPIDPSTGTYFYKKNKDGSPKKDKNGKIQYNRYGHIQIYNGKNWVSDYVQVGRALDRPYRAPNDNYKYTTPVLWRDLSKSSGSPTTASDQKQDIENSEIASGQGDNGPTSDTAGSPSNLPTDNTQVASVTPTGSDPSITGTTGASVTPAPSSGLAANPSNAQLQGPRQLSSIPVPEETNLGSFDAMSNSFLEGNKIASSQVSQQELTNQKLDKVVELLSKEPPQPSTRVQDVPKATATNPMVSSTQPPMNKSGTPSSPTDHRGDPVFNLKGA